MGEPNINLVLSIAKARLKEKEALPSLPQVQLDKAIRPSPYIPFAPMSAAFGRERRPQVTNCCQQVCHLAALPRLVPNLAPLSLAPSTHTTHKTHRHHVQAYHRSLERFSHIRQSAKPIRVISGIGSSKPDGAKGNRLMNGNILNISSANKGNLSAVATSLNKSFHGNRAVPLQQIRNAKEREHTAGEMIVHSLVAAWAHKHRRCVV